MRFSVKEAAKFFNVTEKTIYRWIAQRKMPAYEVGDHVWFNRSELLEWATANEITFSANAFEKDGETSRLETILESAIRAGGIYYNVGGCDVKSALKAVVDVVPIPSGVNRDFLLQVLLARESLGSTGIGHGISVPHPRNPIITHNDNPVVSLCFLKDPVDFGAIDGKPVHTLFIMLSPTVESHLGMLSRVSFALQQSSFMKLIQERADKEVLLRAAAEIDHKLQASAAKAGAGK